MNWKWFLFSFKGRFNRAKFWLVFVVLLAFGWVASIVIVAVGANPMMTQMKEAQEKCQNITDVKEKQVCISQNMPIISDGLAAQEKCKQLTDSQATQECNKLAAKERVSNFWSLWSKMLISMLPIVLVQCWVGLASCAKRLHDLNKSGWFVLLQLVPLVNIGMFIWLGFFKGTTGANRFGADPLQGKVVV